MGLQMALYEVTLRYNFKSEALQLCSMKEENKLPARGTVKATGRNRIEVQE